MKLHSEEFGKYVTPAKMKDGEIGIIRNWSAGSTGCIGRIIQCYGDSLIILGMASDFGWSGANDLSNPEFQIEILPPGTLLEI